MVQVICSKGIILGATKYTYIWKISKDAEKLKDKRLERK